MLFRSEVMRQFVGAGGAPAQSVALTAPPTEQARAPEAVSSSVFSSVADALRAWSTEADATPRGQTANAAPSSGQSLSPRHDVHTASAQLSPTPLTVSRPIRVRIGRDAMQLVETTRGGGEVVTPVELETGRQVKLVFITSPARTAVTAHVSWCRLEPPSAGDGLLQYRAGLTFELDPQTFDRLSNAPEA